MGRKRIFITMSVIMAGVGSLLAQDFFDDVYYNPKKDKSATTVSTVRQTTSKTSTSQQSGYIADMGNMDVDAYNRRGSQYFVSQIDTIGSAVENGEDFIYTQQIQKFYNPTIVVDNATVLGDVLSNAYGNVDIIINDNGYPVFAPYYGWNWPYYSSIWSPWNWGFNIGPWGWSVGWYDPWYSWNWGWGPGWWNPAPPRPGWGPGWGPGWRPGPGAIASWSPNGNRPAAPRPGWSGTTQRRGGNIAAGAPNGNIGRQGGNIRGSRVGQQQPVRGSNFGSPSTGVVNNNGRWQYNTSRVTGQRNPGVVVQPGRNQQGTPNRGTVSSSSSSQNKPAVNNNRGNNSGSSSNRSTFNSSSSNNRSYGNSTSRSIGGGSRSTGGGSRSSGGGGGGRRR
ncbi:MAG: hypothetical protein J1F38_05020 [Muribaculaceae bacterium]|nr:hypothetical protein [Muribaculaceae bacterium]